MTRTITQPWTQPLKYLMAALRRRLDQIPDCRHAIKLPNGAFVELRRLEDGRELVLIGRLIKPVSDKALKAWADELWTFQKHLGLNGWTPVAVQAKAGITAGFASPAPVESAPELR